MQEEDMEKYMTGCHNAGVEPEMRGIKEHLEGKIPSDTTSAWYRKEAAGCWPNGSRVAKQNSEPGDGHADGSFATVVGSITTPEGVGYFVTWDDAPDMCCAIKGTRIRRVDEPGEKEEAVGTEG